MKRSIVTLALVALALGGCSSKAEPGDTAKPAGQSAKKGGKDKPHVNPWAKDEPVEVAETAPAKPAKAADNAKPKDDPWAKDPAPDSQADSEETPVRN